MPGIVVEILGNASQFKRELEGAVKSTNKANSGFARMGKAAGVAGLAIAGGLVVGLDKSVKAAIEGEKSQARLETAFKASHVALAPLKDSLDKVEGSSRKLGFTDDDTRKALGSLIIATHNYKDASHDLGVAQDIARFKGVDLGTATKTLTMAMAGSQRAIKQLGLSVQAVTTEQDKLKVAHDKLSPAQKRATDNAYKLAQGEAKLKDHMATSAQVIDLVKTKLHGQAEEFSKTAAGGMEQFRAQTHHLEESMGKALLPALTKVSEKLAQFMDFLGKHPTLAKALAIGVGILAGALVALSIASSAAAIGMGAAWIAATGGLILVVPAIVAAIILITKHFDAVLTFVKKWGPLVGAAILGPFGVIAAAFATDSFGIRTKALKLFGTVKDDVEKAMKAVAGFITDLPSKIGNFATALYTKFTGFFTGAGIGGWVTKRVQDWADFVAAIPSKILNFGAKLYNTFTGFFTGAGIGGWVEGRVKAWADFIFALPGKIADFGSNLADRFKSFFNAAQIGAWLVERVQKFADAFIELPGKIGDAVGGAMHFLKDKLQDLFSAKKIIGWIKDALFGGSPSKALMELGSWMVDSIARGVGGAAGLLKDAVVKMAKDIPGIVGGLIGGVGSSQPPQGAGPGARSEVLGWLSAALEFTHHMSGANLAALYGRTMQESGGNPRAINLWDSNAKAGHPSKGLLQTIDSTFNAYSAPAHKDIWNPVDNAIAAIRYMYATYGHIVGASGTGYDQGGILPPGVTLAVNNTGRPEAVIPLGRGMGGVTNVFNFPNYHGDKRELVGMVRDALVQAGRRNGGGMLAGLG